MLNKYNADISNLFKNRRRKLILRPLLAALSTLVVLSTSYMLMQPGVTLEKSADDGQTEQVQSINDTPAASVTTESTTATTDAQSMNPEDTQFTEPTGTLSIEPTTIITNLQSAESTVTPTSEPSTDPTVTPSLTPTVTPSEEYSFENDTVSVTAVLSEDTVLPADAKLQVMDITQESDPERYSAFQKLLQPVTEDATTDASNALGMLAYDIGFFVDGTEVEPIGGSVQVTINYKSPLIDAGLAEDVTIYHVVETESSPVLETVQDVQSVISDEGTVESLTFATDSFSAFVIPSDGTMSADLHYLLLEPTSTPFSQTPYYNSLSPLGIAGSFHIVAFDTATLGVHTNGNILAKNLSARGNFGTKNYGVEFSYIQKYLQIVSGSSDYISDILAIGSSNNLYLVDNKNHFAISPPGGTIENPTQINQPFNIWQDDDTASYPYINLDNVQAQIGDVSSFLGTLSNSNMTLYTDDPGNQHPDANDAYIKLTSGATLGVYNITATDLATKFPNGMNVYSLTGSISNPLNVSPTDPNDKTVNPNNITAISDTVIINIDCQNIDVTVPFVRMFLDAPSSKENYVSTTEVTSPMAGVTGKIILNFIHSAGVTITLKQTYATVIAPYATIIVNQNLNGTIIGNNVTINAESHRTDFTGSLSLGSVTAKKEWYANDGTTQLSSSSITDLSVSVQLYCNNSAMAGTEYTVTLDANQSWSKTWSGLNIGSGQKYSVREVSISKNSTVIQTGELGPYTVAYTNNGGISNGQIGISNTVAPGSVQVTKTWYAVNGTTQLTGTNLDGLSATVQLYCNNFAMVDAEYTVPLNASNDWSHTWGGLDISSGQQYTVKETAIGGYSVTYTNNSGIQNGIIAVTNTMGHPFVLPPTGGSGTGVLYATGIVLLLSFFLLTGMKMRYRKRKGETSSA